MGWDNEECSIVFAASAIPAWPVPTTRRIRPSVSRPELDIARLIPAADWASLPAALRRRFGVGHGPARYEGAMDLECSRAGRWFAWLVRPFGGPLPTAPGRAVPVSVDVQSTAGGVLWSRQLGPAQMVRSVKSPGPGGTVVERTTGGLGMVLDVSVDAGALVFSSRSFFFAVGPWRVPIPAILTPGQCRVEHRAVDADRFRFTLTMVHPLWGTTSRQTGVFTDMPEHQP